MAYVKLLIPNREAVGEIKPNVLIPTPVKIPPLGLANIWYGSRLLHILGIAVIVGIGGLIANKFNVSVLGQLIAVGVITTE